MSGERHIGCHQRLPYIKSPVPWLPGHHGQSHPLFANEPKTQSPGFLLEYTVLLDEIFDEHLLLAVEPAGQGDYQEIERLYLI
jgi:hypothetical protein